MPQRRAIPWRKDFDPPKRELKNKYIECWISPRSVESKKTTRWGKGAKTKIWHTRAVTYYHTDNVSTLITVLNPHPARISSRYFTQRFTKMLVRSSGRSPSSPNLFFTRTNSNSFCSCQNATSKKLYSQELFAWILNTVLSVDFRNSFGRDPRLRRPLTRKHSQATART